MFDGIKSSLVEWLVRYLTKETYRPESVSGLGFNWRDVIQPGDVLLIEGNTRISVAIKYLTQSTWSHAALVMDAEKGLLMEADVKQGVTHVSAEKYRLHNVRVCRPIGVTDEDRDMLLQAAESYIGVSYDVKNLVDLARYLMPTPPVPIRFRRQMLTLGSGDPTEKLICSAMIARAFQSIRYPILPTQWLDENGRMLSKVRHYSLFVPRDFDLSPYFEVVKPTVVHGFDYHELVWHEEPEPSAGV